MYFSFRETTLQIVSRDFTQPSDILTYTIDWGTYVITNSNYKKLQIITKNYKKNSTFLQNFTNTLQWIALSENSETWMNIMVEYIDLFLKKFFMHLVFTIYVK